MNEEQARQFREACALLVEGWKAWTSSFRDILPREGEDGRLDFDTAWECARVEYTWRRKHEATRKGKEQWQGYYKVAIANSRKRYEDAEREKGLRLTAEGDRDTYKARWEERGRTLESLLVDVENLRKALAEAQARADRIDDANMRLCALRETDRTGKDATTRSAERDEWRRTAKRLAAELDDVRSEPAASRRRECRHNRDFLSVARVNTHVHDVVRIADAERVGVIRAHGDGFNAYALVTESPGIGARERFVGWYTTRGEALVAVTTSIVAGESP